jgi:hypothetical protein
MVFLGFAAGSSEKTVLARNFSREMRFQKTKFEPHFHE